VKKQILNEQARRMQKLAGIKREQTDITDTAVKNIPVDVKNLDKAQQLATTVQGRAKAINSIPEFSGAFQNWFKSLGFQPGKVSKSAIRSEVEKVLTSLGYK
jgi:hypothetical protein